MKTLGRNQRVVYYALYTGVSEKTDSQGNYTGEYEPTYTTPVRAMMNVSPVSGVANYKMNGIETQYTHILVTDDMVTDFDEATIFWIGITPTADRKHNFKTERVARSLNSTTIAVSEVDVT